MNSAAPQPILADNPLRPSLVHLVAMFLAAVLIRCLLLMVGARAMHQDMLAYASQKGTDSYSYIQYAKFFCGEPADLTAYDQRVFPGYPFFMAALHLLRIPVIQAGLLISWTCSGIVAVLAALLYRDWRMGWALVFLIPQYVIASSMIMNEPLLLALATGGLLAGIRGRAVVAGLLLGIAGATRPNACFALAGYVAFELLSNRRYRAAVATALSGLVVLGFLGFLWVKMGDPFVNVRAYKNNPDAFAGQLVTWPFVSLVMTPIRTHVPLWKIVYCYSHVLVLAVACALFVIRYLCRRDRLDALSGTWLLGNTAFILCMGHIWGFSGFPRATTWALPPFLAAYLPFYPKKWLGWLIIGAVALAIALAFFIRGS
jgi:hypothetical protein